MPSGLIPLGQVLSSVVRPPAHLRTTNVDDATWREVVGVGIVKRAMPARLREGVLTVRVSSSSWAQQLSMLKEDLCAKLTERGYAVRDLRFSVGPVHAPRRLIGAPIFVPYRAPFPLPDSLERALAQISDTTLRLAIFRAASSNLAWQRSSTVEPPLESPLPGLVPRNR